MNLKTHFLPLKYSLVPYWLFWNQVEQAIWISSKSCFFCCFLMAIVSEDLRRTIRVRFRCPEAQKENRQLNHVKLEYDKHKEEPTDHLTWNHSTRSPVTSVQSLKLKVKRRPAHRLQPLNTGVSQEFHNNKLYIFTLHWTLVITTIVLFLWFWNVMSKIHTKSLQSKLPLQPFLW